MAEFEMFTPEGDRACQQIVDRLVAEAQQGVLTRNMLPERVRKMIQVVQQNHEEVWDTEPQYALAAEISKFVCKPQGWEPIERWDW